MKHERAMKRAILQCVSLMAAWASPVLAGGAPAAWAPKDTLFYAEIPDYKQFQEQFHKTGIYQLSQDEQTKKLTEVYTKAIDEIFKTYAEKLGLASAEELKIEPEGALVLIVLADPPQGEATEPTPHLAIVGNWGVNNAKLQKLLDQITTTATERGGKKEVEEFKGIQITTLHLIEPAPTSQPDEPEMPMNPMAGLDPTQAMIDLAKQMKLPDTVSFATSDTTTVWGSDVQTVQEVLRRMKGEESDNLEANEDFQALKQDCSPLGQMNLFLNIPRIIELATQKDEEAKTTIASLGLDAVRALVLSVSFAPREETNVEVKGSLPIRGEKRGLVKLLTENTPNKSIIPDRTFPEGLVVCGWMNFRFETLMDEIYEIIKKNDPEEAEMFKANLKVTLPAPEGQQGETIDMEEAFKNFTMPLAGYLAMTAPYEKDNVSVVLSVNHKNRESVGKIFTFIGPYLQKRDLMGQSIYDVAIMPIGVSLSLTDTALALGTTPGVEQWVRTGSSSAGINLASDPQFNLTTKHAPKEASAVIYSDGAKGFDAILSLHKKAEAAAESGETPQPSFGFEVSDLILTGMKESIKQIENPEAVKKYLYNTVFTISNDPKGWQFYMNSTKSFPQ